MNEKVRYKLVSDVEGGVLQASTSAPPPLFLMVHGSDLEIHFHKSVTLTGSELPKTSPTPCIPCPIQTTA